MSKDTKPTSPPPGVPTSAAPRPVSVRFREEVVLENLGPERTIAPFGPDVKRQRSFAVCGPSVFIDMGDAMVEAPRSLCIIRWQVPAGSTFKQAVAQVMGSGVVHTAEKVVPTVEGMGKVGGEAL